MSSLQYLEVVFCFLSLTELTSFLLSFVLWSFQVLGKDSMDYGTRSGKSLRLGMPKAPQGNIQGQPKAYAWGCPGRHPLFRLRSLVTLLGAIFLFTTHDMCFAWRVILFSFVLLVVWIKYQDLEFLNVRESSHSYIIIQLLIDLHLYLSE